MSTELLEERLRALADLIAVRQPLLEVVARVRALPWDIDVELVVLDRSAALTALLSYRSGDPPPNSSRCRPKQSKVETTSASRPDTKNC